MASFFFVLFAMLLILISLYNPSTNDTTFLTEYVLYHVEFCLYASNFKCTVTLLV